NRLLKTLRKVGQHHAERLGMASEIVLRKKVLEALVRTGYPCGPYSLPAELTGWRRELMGAELLALANQFSSRGQPACRRSAPSIAVPASPECTCTCRGKRA